MAWRDGEGWIKFLFSDDGREREMGMKMGTNMNDMSRYEKSGVQLA